jgi:hypothetical protein
LLTLIYQLIERAEEDEERSENEGTAWASQDYLVAQLGMSESRGRAPIHRRRRGQAEITGGNTICVLVHNLAAFLCCQLSHMDRQA